MFDDLDTDRRPLVLVWEVTQACELACRHCRADAKPARHPDELTTEEGKRLLREAAEFGDGQLVVLSGGDPLAREDLPELVRYGTDLGNRMTVTPSGTRSLAPDRVRELADAGMCRMALSLDGASAESHDAFRGEASFADTVAAAEAARDAGVPSRSTRRSVRRRWRSSRRSATASASWRPCSGPSSSSFPSGAGGSSTPSPRSARRP